MAAELISHPTPDPPDCRFVRDSLTIWCQFQEQLGVLFRPCFVPTWPNQTVLVFALCFVLTWLFSPKVTWLFIIWLTCFLKFILFVFLGILFVFSLYCSYIVPVRAYKIFSWHLMHWSCRLFCFLPMQCSCFISNLINHHNVTFFLKSPKGIFAQRPKISDCSLFRGRRSAKKGWTIFSPYNRISEQSL